MNLDDHGYGPGDLSPEVERFLAPRPGRPIGDAVKVAASGGGVASLGALLVLTLSRQDGAAGFVLAAKVIGLELTGDAGFVDSIPGIVAILIGCLALGSLAGALFGVVIAKFVGRVGVLMGLVVGITYGLLAWIVGQFVIVASIAPNAVALTDQHAMMVASVVYGSILGILGGWTKSPDNHSATFRLRRLWG